MHLVKEAEYPEGDTQNSILRDTMTSGIASDKIWAKVIKEGKGVTLGRVMEIARLEVSTQRHIDRMQETAKVNYVQFGKNKKLVEAVEILETLLNMVEWIRKFHYLQTFAGDVEKADTIKDKIVKQ